MTASTAPPLKRGWLGRALAPDDERRRLLRQRLLRVIVAINLILGVYYVV